MIAEAISHESDRRVRHKFKRQSLPQDQRWYVVLSLPLAPIVNGHKIPSADFMDVERQFSAPRPSVELSLTFPQLQCQHPPAPSKREQIWTDHDS